MPAWLVGPPPNTCNNKQQNAAGCWQISAHDFDGIRAQFTGMQGSCAWEWAKFIWHAYRQPCSAVREHLLCATIQVAVRALQPTSGEMVFSCLTASRFCYCCLYVALQHPFMAFNTLRRGGGGLLGLVVGGLGPPSPPPSPTG